jgi:hypothetical protein
VLTADETPSLTVKFLITVNSSSVVIRAKGKHHNFFGTGIAAKKSKNKATNWTTLFINKLHTPFFFLGYRESTKLQTPCHHNIT